jgi:4-hydroxy-tetrahydrodipicolinate synthase
MFDEEDMSKALRIIVDQTSGRVPVYMGVGAIRTSACVRIARMGAETGAAGISILQPMFLKPTEDELASHFRTIAGSVKDTPVLLYNNLGRTGYAMGQTLVERLGIPVGNPILPSKPSPEGQMEKLRSELKKAGYL